MGLRLKYGRLLAAVFGCALILAAVFYLYGRYRESKPLPPQSELRPKQDDIPLHHAPAFRDPALASSAASQVGTHPIARALSEALVTYDRRWGTLPDVRLDPQKPITADMSGPQVARLRQRLGLGSKGVYDAKLTKAVRAFQVAHGIRVSGIADASTIAALNAGPGHFRQIIRLNRDRAFALPPAEGRSIIVNTAAARLWLYEGDRVVTTMRVVVGRPAMQTPVLYGLIRYAVFNPYWNVPPDLVRDRIAAKVLSEGTSYIDDRDFELLSGWSENARPLEADAVDWRAVQSGALRLRVRQLPGPENSMGRVKFMSPNPLGIYLHDTPDKELFAETDRYRSSGCIRVADSQRLAGWLFGGTVPHPTQNDVRVDLPAPVPVYIVYLTAFPEGGKMQFTGDPYQRDSKALAQLKR